MPNFFTNELLQQMLTNINNAYQMSMENSKRLGQIEEDIQKILENQGVVKKVK